MVSLIASVPVKLLELRLYIEASYHGYRIDSSTFDRRVAQAMMDASSSLQRVRVIVDTLGMGPPELGGPPDKTQFVLERTKPDDNIASQLRDVQE